jgi:hypothetical protein
MTGRSDRFGFDASLRTIDLRLAIDAYYDFGFRAKIARSSSNSLAAIYFSRQSVDTIARDLGLTPDTYAKMGPLQNAVRQRVGCEPRGQLRFDWLELASIIDAVEIPVDPDGYDTTATASEPTEPSPDDDADGLSWGDVAEVGR